MLFRSPVPLSGSVLVAQATQTDVPESGFGVETPAAVAPAAGLTTPTLAQATPAATPAPSPPAAKAEVPAPAPTPAPETKTEPAAAKASTKVRLKTSQGDIVLELNAEKAPVTVENFLSYVKKKQYDGTVFHRVINGFMIQGGGFTQEGEKLTEKPTGKGIVNESKNGLKNDRGTIAMARTSDPNSATAQFFINVKDNAGLNYPSGGGYAVFGKVVEGMDVVDKIKAVKTRDDARLGGDVPVEPITINSATAE